jgi:hypothetical protein
MSSIPSLDSSMAFHRDQFMVARRRVGAARIGRSDSPDLVHASTSDMPGTLSEAEVSGGYTACLMNRTRPPLTSFRSPRPQRWPSPTSGSVPTSRGWAFRMRSSSTTHAVEWTHVRAGMEFGVSPFPELRRAMTERSGILSSPSRWIPAKSRLTAEYHAGVVRTRTMPSFLERFESLL